MPKDWLRKGLLAVLRVLVLGEYHTILKSEVRRELEWIVGWREAGRIAGLLVREAKKGKLPFLYYLGEYESGDVAIEASPIRLSNAQVAILREVFKREMEYGNEMVLIDGWVRQFVKERLGGRVSAEPPVLSAYVIARYYGLVDGVTGVTHSPCGFRVLMPMTGREVAIECCGGKCEWFFS
jgi:hypothetical protein